MAINPAGQSDLNAIDLGLLPRAQWRVVVNALPWSITATTGAAASLAALLYWVENIAAAAYWFVALCAVTAIRVVVLRRRGREAVLGRSPDAARRALLGGLAATGLLWGVAAVIFIRPGDMQTQVLFCFFAAGLTAGSAAGLCAVPWGFVVSSSPLLVMLVARLIHEGTDATSVMAAAVTVFAVGMYGIARNGHRQVARALQLWLANRRLHLDLVKARESEEAARRSAGEFRDAKLLAEAATEAKSRFLATVSHELRTPLNGVIGFSDMILNEFHGPVGDPKYKDYASEIWNCGNHLCGMIDKILELSGMGQTSAALQAMPVPLRRLCESVTREFAASTRGQSMTFTTDILPADMTVNGDPRMLRQIVYELLDNAVKFSKPDDEIRIEGRFLPDRQVRLRVQDRGIGIPAEKLFSVTAPFMQADDSYERSHEGVGLGLALVKHFIDLHRGDLLVENGAENGVTVDVTLPQAALAPRAADAQSAEY